MSMLFVASRVFFFFFNDTATTEIYTLSVHDALPISKLNRNSVNLIFCVQSGETVNEYRSEEHTSELQSHHDIVCRLLLEKKKHIEEGEQLAATRASNYTIRDVWETK